MRMTLRHHLTPAVLACVTMLASRSAHAQFSQQGAKLVGTGAVGSAAQGVSVALSADGDTAIVGGPGDNSGAGAAWVWTRSAGVWTQQGPKLVGSGTVGTVGYSIQQGWSVSLSSDGNTAIVGGPGDNSAAGAAWVWTRSGGVWTQQGPKLVGSGVVGNALLGTSVSLSADGNTAIVGGYGDNGDAGAAWVWTRNGGVWTQEGPKLVGSGALGNADQGISVALSTDGNTAIVGGDNDNAGAGAAWVWTRNGGVWTQQGPKLVGAGSVGKALQGLSVSLSADGNTAIVGGYQDNGDAGAAWVWTRSGGVWTQQGAKLVGAGSVGNAQQGVSVSLSGDGTTALVGGYADNGDAGAAWVWTRSGAAFWPRGGGAFWPRDAAWTQHAPKLVGSGSVGSAQQGRGVALSADGKTAIVGGWRDSGWAGAAWVFAAATVPHPLFTYKGATDSVPADQGIDEQPDENKAFAYPKLIAEALCSNLPPGTTSCNDVVLHNLVQLAVADVKRAFEAHESGTSCNYIERMNDSPLQAFGIHPNTSGQQVIASVVLKAAREKGFIPGAPFPLVTCLTGPIQMGQTVTLHGADLDSGVSVSIGGVAARVITVSPQGFTARLRLPNVFFTGVGNQVDVVVKNPGSPARTFRVDVMSPEPSAR